MWIGECMPFGVFANLSNLRNVTKMQDWKWSDAGIYLLFVHNIKPYIRKIDYKERETYKLSTCF